MLAATFDHVFDGAVAFRKTQHDPLLARLALEANGPAATRLRAFVQKLLAPLTPPTST